MLTRLALRQFRCFESLECELGPGTTIICGKNAQGKTSLLEGASVLLRLQSPRSSTLSRAIRHGARGFVLDGHFAERHLQFYYGTSKRKLALDSVEQKNAAHYLERGRLVYLSNHDITIVRGPAEHRRRFLDFVAPQIDPSYRRQLRVFEKALRSRNQLLKAPRPSWREISAFDGPFVEAGEYLIATRNRLIEALAPRAAEAHRVISGSAEKLSVGYRPNQANGLGAALEANRADDLRLRQTGVGPHRDDLHFLIDGTDIEFASEGQQRSAALSVKLAEAELIAQTTEFAPLLLIDDIFGELDPTRRNALLSHLPSSSQKLITTTNVDWMADMHAAEMFYLGSGKLTRSPSTMNRSRSKV
jgi:DNA replication and repair protein RecF